MDVISFTENKHEEYVDENAFVSEINIRNNEVNGYHKGEQHDVSTTANVKTGLSSVTPTNRIDDCMKIEDGIAAVNDIKIEFNNKLLFCNHCHIYYEDYCTKCGMLVHILNSMSGAENGRSRELPSHILEIVDSRGEFRVSALKVIPEGVRLGPFTGLSLECGSKLKGGKFVIDEDNSKLLNWMRCVNPAKNASEQNLYPFQCENKLYYRTVREVEAGEECLVYFDVEHKDSLSEDVEVDFVPLTEDGFKDLFACTFCCFGFSAKEHLAKHKNICPRKISEGLPAEGLTQCPSCKIYLYEKEYLGYHMAYCSQKNNGKWIPLMRNQQTVDVSKDDLKNKHLEEKTKSSKYYRKKDAAQNKYSEVYNCERCVFKTNYKQHLQIHIKSKHLEVFSYKCEMCMYKTNLKQCFSIHIKTKHLKKFDYKCKSCEYKTNNKKNLEAHTRTKHLKEFDYECPSCGFKTNRKLDLQRHTKTKHLKEFNYECDMCDYKSNARTHFEMHKKTKHLREFNFICEMCAFKTNSDTHLQRHIRTKHLKEFNYNCASCVYKTNCKCNFDRHVKTVHLKEFDYKCDECEFKTNLKSHFENHIKTEHLKEFNYKCEICEYKTNRKSTFINHTKAKHYEEFLIKR